MKFTDPVTALPLVGESARLKLKRLGITTVGELLHHVPSRYSDYSQVSSIADLKLGEKVTLEGQIISIKNIYTKTGKVMQEAEFSDGENSISVIWFRQAYLAKALPQGSFVAITGKMGFLGRKKAIIAPAWEKISDNVERLHSGRIVPTYPETAGISSKWLRRIVNTALLEFTEPDFLPDLTLNAHHLIGLNDALAKIHKPNTLEDIEEGRRRLAFNELLLHALAQEQRAKNWRSKIVAKRLSADAGALLHFLAKLPFSPTPSQLRSMEEIAKDIALNTPMNRLLEGDVGSGKTLVAAYAMLLSYLNNAASLLMAPTQILAEQHMQTLTALLSPFEIPVRLVTSKDKLKKLNEKAIYVGTHALLFKFVHSAVGVVVIDEQHRFGVAQRAEIAEKSRSVPHVLTMTATPIPRTIALTLYGDLSLSTLDELPAGRKKITTWVVPPKKRDSAYGWIEKQIQETDCQVFIVCPLIDESESEKMKEVKAAKAEFEKLLKIFPNRRLALLHGRLKATEKKEILDSFRRHEIDILVTTPVVEVGIDIPNATIMMIEAADRFGLAALHQLRGRVGRGEKQSYCLLMTESTSSKVKARLEAMSKTMNGRELAELDLSLRGPGEIFGTKQSGLPELKIARWTDVELIKTAKQMAKEVVENEENFSGIYEFIKLTQKSPN